MGLGHKLACERGISRCCLRDGAHPRLYAVRRHNRALTATCELRVSNSSLPRRAVSAKSHSLASCKNWAFFRKRKPKPKTACRSSSPGGRWRMLPSMACTTRCSPMSGMRPGFLLVVPAAWWRVPGENGILVHSLNWQPMLLDYGAIADHDTSTFDRWTIDGDYLFNNAKHLTKIHVVQDSDEMFVAGWGPIAECRIVKHQHSVCRQTRCQGAIRRQLQECILRFIQAPRVFSAGPLARASRSMRNGMRSSACHARIAPLRDAAEPIALFWRGWLDREAMPHCRARADHVTRDATAGLYHHLSSTSRLAKAATSRSCRRASIRQLVWYVRLFGFNRR